MEVVVRGRQIEVSDRFRDHANQRLTRLEQHGFALTRVDVEITKERNPRQADHAIRVELTCRGLGSVVRAEHSASDKFAAFDTAADRLGERLRRSSERQRERSRGNGRVIPPPVAPLPQHIPAPADDEQAQLPEADVVYAAGPVVVREKTHATQAMTVEQALDAMELVGHDFYLFLDAGNGQPSVVYRRRGYDYGLIRLEVLAAPVAS